MNVWLTMYHLFLSFKNQHNSILHAPPPFPFQLHFPAPSLSLALPPRPLHLAQCGSDGGQVPFDLSVHVLRQ